MMRAPGPELQRAIQFLSSPDLAEADRRAFAARPDYEALARRASQLGHELSAGAVEEAFRMLMRARLVALRPRA